MVRLLPGRAPDDRELVGDLRLLREELADLHSRDVRSDRPELAAHLGGRVGLHVVRVEVAGAAAPPDHDDRFGPPLLRHRAVRLQAEKIRKRQAPQREASDLEEAPARNAIAIGPRRSVVEGEHPEYGTLGPNPARHVWRPPGLKTAGELLWQRRRRAASRGSVA